MSALSQAFEIYQKFSTIGFPGLMFMLLVGSYYGVWFWGKDYRKLERDRDEWKGMYLDHVGGVYRETRRKVSGAR